MIHPEAMADLHEPLAELGRRWAVSVHRLKPTPQALQDWDGFLKSWLASDLPLVLRDSRRRGTQTKSVTGRDILFADNTPANWMFGLALLGQVPDLAAWTGETMPACIPLTFLTKGAAAKRDLNKQGWKVCHIDPVSDRKRYAVEEVDIAALEGEFMRFLSPRNVFLIPKAISGAGELPEVIAAIAAADRAAT